MRRRMRAASIQSLVSIAREYPNGIGLARE
jgi:hypothetical protein